MLRKIAGVSGVGSQLVIIFALIVVSSRSPWFNWTADYLSDFGYRGSLTAVYNWGLILTGILSAVFAYGLRKTIILNKTGMRGMTSLFIGSLGISASGILTKSLDIPHDIASSGSVILIILGLLLVGAALIHTPQVKLGFFSIIAGTLPIILWLIPWKWSGDAIPQLFYFTSWSVWVIYFSVALFRSSTVTVSSGLFYQFGREEV